MPYTSPVRAGLAKLSPKLPHLFRHDRWPSRPQTRGGGAYAGPGSCPGEACGGPLDGSRDGQLTTPRSACAQVSHRTCSLRSCAQPPCCPRGSTPSSRLEVVARQIRPEVWLVRRLPGRPPRRRQVAGEDRVHPVQLHQSPCSPAAMPWHHLQDPLRAKNPPQLSWLTSSALL